MAARMLGDIASKIDFSLAYQQTAEIVGITAGEYSLNDINPSVRKAAGLDVHEKELLSPEKKQTFTRCPRYTTPAKIDPRKAESYKRSSTVSLNDLSPAEVH
jgi:hypothetical protein